MSETRNIVILGASYAGVNSAHYFLKHVYPQLPKGEKITYKLIVVDPSEKILLRPGIPRAMVSGKLMKDETLFVDRAPGFTQYGSEYVFIQGSATSWDPEKRTIAIRRGEKGATESLEYHALILATGTRSIAPYYTLQGEDHTDVVSALHAIRDDVNKAKHIVIAGGGPTGVETAGEIGEFLNGKPGWFASEPSHPKATVTLYTNADKLLPLLRPAIAKQAEVYLNRIGVQVRYNTRVASTTKLADGKTQVSFEDGTEVTTDVYIPAMGQKTMTEYAPKHLLDSRGRFKCNPKTTRVDEAGPRVYALGDASSYSKGGLPDINDSVPVLLTNLRRDLLAAHSDVNALPTGPDRLYVENEKELQLVVIGQSKGVGAVFGWRVPSWFVWLIKGRDYMTGKSMDAVTGKAWIKEPKWKIPESV